MTRFVSKTAKINRYATVGLWLVVYVSVIINNNKEIRVQSLAVCLSMCLKFSHLSFSVLTSGGHLPSLLSTNIDGKLS